MKDYAEASARNAAGSMLDVAGTFAVLAIVGFLGMWSASSGYAIRLGDSAARFAEKQALFMGAAMVVFMIAALLPLEKMRKLAAPMALFGLALLSLPFVPGLGVEINGGRRWINLRVSHFQPSELWKIIVVFYLSHILARKRDAIRSRAVESIFPLLVVAAGSAVIYLQHDFSTSALAFVAALSLFWYAGTPKRFFAFAMMLAIPAAFLMIATSEYRLTRVLGFIIPDFDPQGANYQVQNSIRAIISGGFWGKGLGLGTRKLGSIPAIQSDFVFAAFAEEMGLLGVLAVIGLWVFLVWRVAAKASRLNDFPKFLALGLVTLLALQFLINLGVVSGFLPATGIALPFFSAGGSSLLSTAIAAGLIYNSLRTASGAGPNHSSGSGNADSGGRDVD